MGSLRAGLVVAVCHFTFCAAAAAQESNDPWQAARFHFGVVAMSPSISVTNVGIDTNVFAAAEDPQRDFTATFMPATTAILRIGSARLTGQGTVIYQYFDKFVSERSFSTRGMGQLVVPFAWLELTARSSTQNTRQREGAEITARVRRYQTTATGGISVRLSGVLQLGVEANRTRYTFPQREQFLETNLRQVLERHEDTASLVLTHKATPLTTLRFTGEAERDVFELSPERNGTITRATAGFEARPGTMFEGTAMLGYQKYKATARTTRGFQGVVTAANISCVVLGVTRLTGRADRYLAYSYDAQQSYYIGTSFGGEIAQHLFGNWEAIGTGGRQRLDYMRQADVSGETAPRRDWASTFGAGLAYAFGRSGRFRINADATNRKSALADLTYHTWQFSNSLDYAF